MSLKSSENHYGSMAVSLHWLVGVLIIGMIATGLLLEQTRDPVEKMSLLIFHVPMGMSVALLMVIRIVWWLFLDKKPGHLPGPRWQQLSSTALHWLLYILVIVMLASGIVLVGPSGAVPIIFGVSDAPLPKFYQMTAMTPHAIASKVLMASLVLHLAASLYHQYVIRDRIFQRMWY